MVLLVHLVDLGCFHLGVDFFQDLLEVGRSVKLDRVECLLILGDNFLNAVDSWVEDVSVQSETVRCTICLRWDCATKTVQVYHLVGVVELQDLANGLDGLKVLILSRVKVVQ